MSIMSSAATQSANVRRKIESMASTLNLPTVRRALGVLEGEHASMQRNGVGDLIGTREYTDEDEARLINWKLSARAGRPMVTDRERLVTTRIWLMLDTGKQMAGTCPSGEPAWAVAANALCMYAALSSRRHDDISLVLANNSTITRIPCKGGLAQFERTIDQGLNRDWQAKGNLAALLDYASRSVDDGSMIVLATDERSLDESHLDAIHRIATRHPFVLVNISMLNPFAPHALGDDVRIREGESRRRIPAFMRDATAARQTDEQRRHQRETLEQELRTCQASLLQASGSQDMFDSFVALASQTLEQGSPSPLAAPSATTMGGIR